MPQILVLEGLTDATFFQELISRLYLRDAERLYSDLPGRRNMPAGVRGLTSNGTLQDIEFRYLRTPGEDSTGGKAQLPDIIRGLLDEEVRDFAVAQDLDGDSRGLVLQSIGDVVHRHLGITEQRRRDSSPQIAFDNGTIMVLPMGLDQDDELVGLGITEHSLEDYLIKLILEDAALRERAPELQSLLLAILPAIREKDGPFNKSKELFQLIKPIVQHGFSDTGVVQKLIRDADENILRSVLAPLLDDMERAFGF